MNKTVIPTLKIKKLLFHFCCFWRNATKFKKYIHMYDFFCSFFCECICDIPRSPSELGVECRRWVIITFHCLWLPPYQVIVTSSKTQTPISIVFCTPAEYTWMNYTLWLYMLLQQYHFYYRPEWADELSEVWLTDLNNSSKTILNQEIYIRILHTSISEHAIFVQYHINMYVYIN